MAAVMGKRTILLIKQPFIVVVVQLIKKRGDRPMKIVLLLQQLVRQLEVTKTDNSLIVVRGDNDSFDSIHGEYICIY